MGKLKKSAGLTFGHQSEAPSPAAPAGPAAGMLGNREQLRRMLGDRMSAGGQKAQGQAAGASPRKSLQQRLAAHFGSTRQTPPSPGSAAWHRMNEEEPEKLKKLEADRDAARASTIQATPKAPEDAGEKPQWMSQYQWDRFASGTTDGLNPTTVMRQNADQYYNMGAEGQAFLQDAFHKAFESKLSHYMANGATREGAMETIMNGHDYQSYVGYGFEPYEFSGGSSESEESGLGFGPG